MPPSSWSKMTTSASREVTSACNSASFPDPTSVLGSNDGRCCSMRSLTTAPALSARAANSASDSSADNDELAVFEFLRRAVNSTATRIAFSLALPAVSDLRWLVANGRRGRASTRGRGMLRWWAGVNRARNHDCGDGVFEDQLLLIVRLKNHGVLIEALDSTRELHSAH